LSSETGIIDFGVSIPRRELTNAATAEAWGRPAFKGARRIAGPDEDALTLGLSAAFEATQAFDCNNIDGLIFAAMIAEALNLNPSAKVMDLSGSARSATLAVQTAMDFIESGSCNNVLVISADTRIAKPGAMDEFLFGHAGVALLLGSTDSAIATVTHSVNQSDTHCDSWMGANGKYPINGDARFSRIAYQNLMQSTFEQLLEKSSSAALDYNKMVIWSPDPKSGMGFLKGNGFDIRQHYCDDVSFKGGLTGAPHTLLMLVGALEGSNKEDRISVLNFGDGCDALAITVNKDSCSNKLSSAFKQKIAISYNHYLKINNLHVEGEAEYDPSTGSFVSHIMTTRNKKLWSQLIAKQCSSCNTVITLPVPTCSGCGATEGLVDFQLSREGTVFAITHEHYFPTKEAPLGMVMVELQGGGRMTLQAADETPALTNEQKVELVYRKLYTRDDTPHYFWKCRSKGEQL